MKQYLDTLFYGPANQFDFYVSSLNLVDGETKSSVWKKYSQAVFPIDYNGRCEDKDTYLFFKNINQRQILPNEVVLDLESMEDIEKIKARLKELKQSYFLYGTGSRGAHIHLFFKKPLTSSEKLKIIKRYGADEQKASDKCMIALEFAPHWKSKKIKKLLEHYSGE